MSSETNTPASTSTSVAENETVSLTDKIKKYDTSKLIEFLQRQGLGLSETAIKILEEEEVDSHAFLKITEQRFRNYGMKGGPVVKLVKFAECKDKKLKAFSSYRNLKEVLIRYGLESEDTDKIPLFSLQTTKFKSPTSTSSIAWQKF